MDYQSANYLIIKSIHIIFMVSYFAGLFYLIRLFVYYREAMEIENGKVLQSQYEKMIKKLWNIITVPAGLIMLTTGIIMLSASHFFLLEEPWMHIKLTLLLLFLGFHLFIWRETKNIVRRHKTKFTSIAFRRINEIPTLFLFAIVFVVVMKQQFIDNAPKLILGFFVIAIVIFGIIKLVNKKK